jgi:signal transduction histidine kinase
VNKWLYFGGSAGDSGLYLKLVTRVYLIEKVGFRWYSLLKFLRIQVAKRPFIQEALGNAVIHRKARNVLIRACGENYVLFCSLRDDGWGFDSSQVSATDGRKGLALVAVKERVTAIGGMLPTEPRSGPRTGLSIRLPLEGGHANSDCAR